MRLFVALRICLPVQTAGKQPFDFNQPQSPPLPAPAGMKFVDQGMFDPRLKGYFSPEGFKVEIVADSPTVVNPVGMTFGPDGTLFVLEWRPGANGWPETPEVFTYKDGSKHSIATMKKEVKDVVKVLTFNPEKGVYDQARGHPGRRTAFEHPDPRWLDLYDRPRHRPALEARRYH